VVLDKSGLLKSCDLRGHAGAGKRGEDVVCAAVSVLGGTVLKALSVREGIKVRGEAPERGVLLISVDAYDSLSKDFLSACGIVLTEGLTEVAAEYPENVRLSIERRG